jgi:Bacterial protein of unknown function (YtfJ_HI0045)
MSGRFFCHCSMGLFLLFSLSPIVAVSQTFPILKFSITDQFDSLHTEKYYLGGLAIITGSDKNGSQYNKIWIQAIQDSLSNKLNNTQLKFLTVANVSSVPFFLKGLVQSKFPQEKKEWVLLDWKGYLADTYQFVDDASNIMIIDKNGGLVYKTNGQVLDNQKLTAICSKIIELAQSSK